MRGCSSRAPSAWDWGTPNACVTFPGMAEIGRAASAFSVPEFQRTALVIGISYGGEIPHLPNARRDAEAIAACLRRRHGYADCRLLVDGDASGAAIVAALEALAARVGPQHQVVFYFAGHGLATPDETNAIEGYLLPAGAKLGRESTYLRMRELRSIFRKMGERGCHHLLVVLDCCFAGVFARTVTKDVEPWTERAAPKPVYERWIRHRAFQLLTSAAHDEEAVDSLIFRAWSEGTGVDPNHSPFARALLDGLGEPCAADLNGDGIVTARDLAAHLDKTFHELAQRTPLHQTPHLWTLDWHEAGEFVFLVGEPRPRRLDPLLPDKNPYRGLEPFERDQRHLFFGRERVVTDLHAQIRAAPLTVVLGPSGVGKSSILRAGLLPLLDPLDSGPGWEIIGPMRPTAQPLTALAAALEKAGYDRSPAAHCEATLDDLAAAPRIMGVGSVLLVVDQLEELLTMTRDDEERALFLGLLGVCLHEHPMPEGAPLVASIADVLKRCKDRKRRQLALEIAGMLLPLRGRLHTLVVVRSDYEPHFVSALASPADAMQKLWSSRRFVVPDMNREELRACIEKPAAHEIVFFDACRRDADQKGKPLVETLLDEVDGMPGALPLLSLALSEMFLHFVSQDREDRTIGWDDYDFIGGGVIGALERCAETLYPPHHADLRETLLRVLARMVAIEGGETARRRVHHDELCFADADEQTRVRQVVQRLIDARLAVGKPLADRPDLDATGHVEPAHDALVKAWPLLLQHLEKRQGALILHRNLWEAAKEWNASRRQPSALWDDERVIRLRELAQLGPAPPTNDATPRSPLARWSGAALSWLQDLRGDDRVVRAVPPHTLNRLEREFMLESLRVRRRRRALFVGLVMTVMAVLAVTTGVALRAANAARAAATAEQKAKDLAIEKQEIADQQADLALDMATKASLAAEEADFQRDWASDERDEANKQRDEARRQRDEAERAAETVQGAAAKMLAQAGGDELRALAEGMKAMDRALAAGHAPSAQSWQGLLDALSSARRTTTFRTPTEGIDSPLFLDNTTVMAIGSGDEHKEPTLLFWDVRTGHSTRSPRHLSVPVTDLVAHRGTTVWARGKWSTFWSLDLTARQEAREPIEAKDLWVFAATPGGRPLLLGARKHETDAGSRVTVEVLTEDAQTRIASLDGDMPKTIPRYAFDEAGRWVALWETVSTYIGVWDLESGNRVAQTFALPHAAIRVAISPDRGRIVACTNRNELVIYDGAQQELKPFDERATSSAAFSFAREWVAIGTGGKVELRSFQGNKLDEIRSYRSEIVGLEASPDGRHVVIREREAPPRSWHVEQGPWSVKVGEEILSFKSVALSADDQRVAAAGADNRVLLYDPARPEKKVGELEGFSGNVLTMAFSPRRDRLLTVSVSDKLDLLVQVHRQSRESYVGTNRSVNIGPGKSSRAAFSPDGHLIAVWRDDLPPMLFEVLPTELRRIDDARVRTIQTWAPSPGLRGTSLADASTGARSPDGRFVAKSTAGSVVVMDGAGRNAVLTYPPRGTGGRVSRVGFTSDGRSIVVTYDDDGVIFLYPFAPEALLVEACKAMRTADEWSDVQQLCLRHRAERPGH